MYEEGYFENKEDTGDRGSGVVLTIVYISNNLVGIKLCTTPRKLDKSTFIGPAQETGLSTLSAPKMEIEGDHMIWLEEVNEWMINVIACLEVVNSHAKGVSACMDITFHISLNACMKEHIK